MFIDEEKKSQLKMSSSNILCLTTPLGTITLEALVDGSWLSKVTPDCYREISNHTTITQWIRKDIQIELLRSFINPALPIGMHVSKCVAYIWRFKNLSKTMNIQFRCRLVETQRDLEGGPHSGEGLAAQTWDHGTVRITIGTEDEDDLLSRAEQQHSLPLRLAMENLISPKLISYLEDGIDVKLPTFLENEEGQIQFIAAWAEGIDPEDNSTWFAVDQSAQKIIEQAAACT